MIKDHESGSYLRIHQKVADAIGVGMHVVMRVAVYRKGRRSMDGNPFDGVYLVGTADKHGLKLDFESDGFDELKCEFLCRGMRLKKGSPCRKNVKRGTATEKVRVVYTFWRVEV